MKKIVIALVLPLFFLNCSTNDGAKTNEIAKKLVGKWQLVQNLYFDNEDPTNYHYIVNGYIYELKSDGTFLRNNTQNNVSESGSYLISKDSIIKFTYNNQSQILEKKIIFFENDTLRTSYDLTATYNNAGCDDGCGESFKKLVTP